MKLFDSMRSRRAVRDFQTRAVEPAVIRELIQAAALAPSAMNRQAWAFTVVCDRTLLCDISEQAKAYMLHSLDTDGALSALRGHLASPTFNAFYDAPAAIVISATSSDDFAIYDCYLAATHLMLAAWDRGLGTCWIGMAEGWLNTDQGKSQLRIPDSQRPVATIILGYPRVVPRPTSRGAPPITWIGVLPPAL
jgi:nitroreductase